MCIDQFRIVGRQYIDRREGSGYLEGRLASDVRNEEVHREVFTVEVLIHFVSDRLRHHVGVQVTVVLQGMGRESERDAREGSGRGGGGREGWW